MRIEAVITAAVAALAGAVLGRWPLADWAERSMQDDREQGERMLRAAVRFAAAAITALTFAALALRFGMSWTLLPLLAFAAAATVLTIVDLAEHRLPNAVVFPTLVVVAALLVLASAMTGAWIPLLWALGGAAAMFTVYFLLALISPSSMGMGDVKLALVIGLLLGWFGLNAWLIGLLAAFVFGGVAAVVALALHRVTLRGSIPFGPSMLAGALAAVLLVGP